MTQDELKALVGRAALDHVVHGQLVGVGTGSTVNHFIDALATVKDRIAGAVSSSLASTERLRRHGIPVFEANEVDDGYIFVLVYGSRSDWVRNVVAAGSAKLEVDGRVVDLVEPKLLIAEEAFARLPPDTKRPPGFLRIGEFLHMRRAEPT